jgi:hypothetical protein
VIATVALAADDPNVPESAPAPVGDPAPAVPPSGEPSGGSR